MVNFRLAVAVAVVIMTAATARAQSAYDVCRMGIESVERQRAAVNYVRARWERALSHARESVAKTLAIANMESWYAENMRDLNEQLAWLQSQCDPGSQVRRGEPASRVAQPQQPRRPRVRRPAPQRQSPPSGSRRYPPYERAPDPVDPFDSLSPR